jgi:hypothetical protein
MAIRLKVEWSGLDEIQKVLKLLPLDVQDSVMKSTHKKAAQPLIAQAIQNAPLGDANKRRLNGRYNKRGARTVPLKDSIKAVSGGSIQKSGEIGAVRIGALRRQPYRAYHAGLVEFGSKPGGRPPGGWYAQMQRRLKQFLSRASGKKGAWKNGGRTVMPSNPFMERSWNATKDVVLNAIGKITGDRITATLKRNLRKK